MTEFVAAESFLDEVHQRPEYLSRSDNNQYTLGAMGKHHIVITFLPEYGTDAAATVATSMLHSFPNIRIGLMVGIGGGAPSPDNDIRLGDIIVSNAKDGKSSVFQYDFGKAIQGKGFKPTRFLNQAPSILRTAATRLQGQHSDHGRELEDAIEMALQKSPKLRETHRRPASSTDQLYKAEVSHPPDGNSACAIVCSNRPSNLVQRPQRTHLKVHYGRIASGNAVMKDAAIRDELARTEGILCFEMEAAGLMNHFPCLVIRGVCDYSDSHKNKEWQGYAAMAAAAYARDLLSQISHSDVEAGTTIVDLNAGLAELVAEVKHISEESRKQGKLAKLGEFLAWLTKDDSANRHNDVLEKRQEGTGQWLLKSGEFMAWLEHGERTLFCPGIPGAGKTVISAIVIEHLQSTYGDDESTIIGYIYCTYRQKEKVQDMLLSLLKQLVWGRDSLPDSVKKLFEKHTRKRTRPSIGDLCETLCSVAAAYPNVFIIVDALDECISPDNDHNARTKFLDAIFELQARTSTKLFTTSRPPPDIEKRFKGCPTVRISAQKEDVQRYLRGKMSGLLECISGNLDLQKEIEHGVAPAADGMFLLAQLYFDSLRSKTCESEVESMLKDLGRNRQHRPTPGKEDGTLDKAYEDAMERINQQQGKLGKLAKNAISWIAFAKRPLSPAELKHALADSLKEDDDGKFNGELDEKSCPNINDVVRVCIGLVAVDSQSDIVRLVHFTAQEYFVRTQRKWFPDAKIAITKTCILYLSLNVFENRVSLEDKDFYDQKASYALYDYTSHHWGHHAREASDSTTKTIISAETLMRFLGCEGKVEASYQELRTWKSWSWGTPHRPSIKQVSGLHLAARFGVCWVVDALLEDAFRRDKRDERDSDGRTPLMYAVTEGHASVVRLLISTKGVDINSRESRGYTPLVLAIKCKHAGIAELLLAVEGVEINARENEDAWPLMFAVSTRSEGVVELLLSKKGIIVSPRDVEGWTPLTKAAMLGHYRIVRQLVQADSESEDGEGRTAIGIAVKKQDVEVLGELLTSHKINPNLRHNGKTPIFWATEPAAALALGHDYPDMPMPSRSADRKAFLARALRLLTALATRNDLDMNQQNKSGQTPLTLLAAAGLHEMVEILLRHAKVQPNAGNRGGRTALTFAADRGNEALVRLLVARDEVKPDCRDLSGRKPLSRAAENGFTSIVRLLVARLATYGVDPGVPDRYGKTPLGNAAQIGHEAIVRLLLEGGLDPCGDRDQMPLVLASRNGHEAVVRALLDCGASPNLKDLEGQTALSWASRNGHEAVVRLLLERGSKPDLRDGMGQTALFWASRNGHEAAVGLLLGHGAESDVKDDVGKTPLFWASQKWHEGVVRLLRAHGAELGVEDNVGQTQLPWTWSGWNWTEFGG